MILQNHVEFTDSQYREKLKDTLNMLIPYFESTEDFEICSACVRMLQSMDSQNTETIKSTLSRVLVLAKLSNIC